MALSSQSLFLYGYSVTLSNQNLDFQAVSGGPVLTATLALGDYSLSTLLSALTQAMAAADTAHVYTWTADRTLVGGLQNRVSVSTNGTFLSLLFASGPNHLTALEGLIGFNPVDYTGSTGYTGAQTTGQTLIPDFIGYNYLDQDAQAKLQGAVNISTSGVKESVVFTEMYFINVEFMYEPKSKLVPQWVPLRDWMIRQKPFDFTPEISNPTKFFTVTLEKSPYDGKGLGFQMKEMLPNFPNFYQTGSLEFRVVLDFNVTVFMS